MIRAVANVLIRMYPREWRSRYETEVRALMEDRAPVFADLPVLVANAGTEWGKAATDPLERPVLWSLAVFLRGISRDALLLSGAFIGTWATATLLEMLFGDAPSQVGTACGLAALGIAARMGLSSSFWATFPLSIKLRPFTRRELTWSAYLMTAAVVGIVWTGEPPWLNLWICMIAIHAWMDATPAGWSRARATARVSQIRAEWRDFRIKLAYLVPMREAGEVTHEEVARTVSRMARLHDDAMAASRITLSTELFEVDEVLIPEPRRR